MYNGNFFQCPEHKLYVYPTYSYLLTYIYNMPSESFSIMALLPLPTDRRGIKISMFLCIIIAGSFYNRRLLMIVKIYSALPSQGRPLRVGGGGWMGKKGQHIIVLEPPYLIKKQKRDPSKKFFKFCFSKPRFRSPCSRPLSFSKT
jgi:hypothetical protein